MAEIQAKTFSNLPEDVLIPILMHLDAYNLKKMASMNVNLSSIIANRPALYRKFTLKIGPHLSDEQFDFLESENTRGVSQISFVGFLPEYTPRMNSIVDRILDKYGSGIKIVSFGRYRSNRARQFFTWQYLYKILKKTENVEELVFEACEFSNDNVYDNFGDLEKIHLKCLRKLSAEDETRIGSLMNFLAPVTSLQHLTVTDGSDFISIYNPQQHLKSLFCKEANSSLISFISPETLKSLKLEELSDLPYQLIGSPQENYKLFLESQKTSLKFLRISTSLGLWPSILRLENLKSLETALIRKIPAPVRINSSVQSLKLHLKDCKYFPIKLKKFLRQFVNLRDLKLILEMEGSGFGWNPLKLSTRLVHLESVTIILHYDNDLFKKLKIDKLKVFIVTNVTCVPSIWKGLFERCPNIRVLEIENSFMNIDILFLICTKLKHLEELTLTPRSPLDYFQPFDMTCDHQSLKIILKNCAKLKSLKIVLTGTYTSYRPLLRRFKKKLQNIKCDLEYTNIDFMATGEEDEFDVSDESYDSDDNEPSSKVARIS